MSDKLREHLENIDLQRRESYTENEFHAAMDLLREAESCLKKNLSRLPRPDDLVFVVNNEHGKLIAIISGGTHVVGGNCHSFYDSRLINLVGHYTIQAEKAGQVKHETAEELWVSQNSPSAETPVRHETEETR